MVISSIAAIKLKFFKYISYLLIASSFSLNTFQIAVEQKWIQPPDSCKQKVIPMYKLKNMSIDEKQKALKQMHVVPCDVIAWKFLGISMTIWFELAIVLIIVCKFLIILT